MRRKESDIAHKLFIAGIVIKAIDGVLDLIGGIVLFFVRTQVCG